MTVVALHVKREFKENYIRMMKGYNPREPTTIFEKIFYILWCVLCGIHIIANRFLNHIKKIVH